MFKPNAARNNKLSSVPVIPVIPVPPPAAIVVAVPVENVNDVVSPPVLNRRDDDILPGVDVVENIHLELPPTLTLPAIRPVKRKPVSAVSSISKTPKVKKSKKLLVVESEEGIKD